ncbi:hypothetical protein BV22DRAFT_1052697, partial [Leucogyrophana mollusca]
MDVHLGHPDIPFPLVGSGAPLPDALAFSGKSINVPMDLATCCTLGRPIVFPRAFLPFIALLNSINLEITNTWSSEDQEAQIYWISMRGYLNALLKDTLEFLEKKQKPTALQCWLQREFMLCRHDEAGRREYLNLMKEKNIVPYSVDMFELGKTSGAFLSYTLNAGVSDWFGWWKTQKDWGYYSSEHFGKFLYFERKSAWKVVIQKAGTSNPAAPSSPGSPPNNPDPMPVSESSATSSAVVQVQVPGSQPSGIGPVPGSESAPERQRYFSFKLLSHDPPALPQNAAGNLDWDIILRDLCSLSETWVVGAQA